MKKIAIFGAGGFGREIAQFISQINSKEPSWEIIGFFDDAPDLQGKRVGGIRILGGLKELNNVNEKLAVALAVGLPESKRILFDSIFNPNIVFPRLIHPGVALPDETDLGLGCIICAGNILTVNVRLEDFVTVNLRCTIGHDTRIGAFSSIMPGVSVSGDVTIEEEVYIGTGASILNGVKIGSGSIVGAGALVNKSLPENCTAVGVPARIVRIFER